MTLETYTSICRKDLRQSGSKQTGWRGRGVAWCWPPRIFSSPRAATPLRLGRWCRLSWALWSQSTHRCYDTETGSPEEKHHFSVNLYNSLPRWNSYFYHPQQNQTEDLVEYKIVVVTVRYNFTSSVRLAGLYLLLPTLLHWDIDKRK